MAVKKLKHARVSAQKIIRQNSKAKVPQKLKNKIKVKDRKALIVAQEIKFARLLAGNDKRVRDKVLKNLKKWLTVRSKSSFAFVEADFLRLWKGLFYCMWMSDKPLIQEELAESLSNIVHCFDATDTFLLYTHCTLKTLATEWYGIDQFRIDKFSMLVRRVFRQTFKACKQRAWNKECIIGISDLIERVLLSPQTNLGFIMHVVELYLEELAKVGEGSIPADIVTLLVKPFVVYIVTIHHEKQIKHVVRHIFRYLILQSDIGLDYAEKFHAWKQAGYPTGNIEAMERMNVDSEDDTETSEEEVQNAPSKNGHNMEKPLDPRAGKVDVELPQLHFNPDDIINLIKQYRFGPTSTMKSRRYTALVIKELTLLAQGNMPIGVKDVRVPFVDKDALSTKKGAQRLLEFNNDLYSDTPKREKQETLMNDNDDDDDHDYEGDEEIRDDQNEHEDKDNQISTESESAKDNEQEDFGNDKLEVKNAIAQPTKLITSKSDSIVSNLKKKLKKRKRDVGAEESAIFEKNKKQSIATLLSMKSSKKPKKTKNIQNGSENKTILETFAKLKKSKQIETCGNWDISDNVPPPKPAKLVCDKGSKVEIIDNVKVGANNLKNQFGNQTMWLTSVLGKIEHVSNKSAKSLKEPNKQISEEKTEQSNEQSPKKRVKIVLQRNTAQNTSEYIRQIRQSPAIPFDANKKPLASALKANAIPSPVNPFYKRKLK